MKEWFGLAARLVTGGVWIWAGVVKLPDPATSVQAVRAYQLLPSSVVPTVGQLLPVVEVVVGAALVLGILTRGAAVASALLFALFVIGIASVWARGITIDCGCFGGGGFDPEATSKYPGRSPATWACCSSRCTLAWLPRTRFALDNALLRRTPATEGP